MAFHREIDPDEPIRLELSGGRHERRPERSSWHLATGTLACPACDAPVLPSPAGMAPADPLACGFCDEAGTVSDFLSLSEPTRPARVVVRVHGLALR